MIDKEFTKYRQIQEKYPGNSEGYNQSIIDGDSKCVVDRIS